MNTLALFPHHLSSRDGGTVKPSLTADGNSSFMDDITFQHGEIESIVPSAPLSKSNDKTRFFFPAGIGGSKFQECSWIGMLQREQKVRESRIQMSLII